MARNLPLLVVTTLAASTLAIPSIGLAQTAGGTSVQPWVAANIGIGRPSSSIFSTSAVYSSGGDREELSTRYARKSDRQFDIGGGVLLRDRIQLGLSVSHTSDARPGTSTLSLNHPPFHPTITDSADTEPASHTETGVHIQLGYRVPVPGPFEVTFFGGPSHFSASQDVVADLDYDEVFNRATNTWSTTITELETERKSGSAWGYHVGADVGLKLSPKFTVGLLTRYSRADVQIEDPVASMLKDRTVTTTMGVGGLQVMGGVRVRF